MKKKALYKILLFFCILFIYGEGDGNNTTPNPNTQEHCKYLFDLAEKERINENYGKALEYLTEATGLAENNGWLDLKRQSLVTIGFVYQNMMDYDKAIDYYLEVYQIAIQLSDKIGEIDALNNIACIYQNNEKLEECRKYMKKSYDIALEINDTARIITLANNLALIYIRMENIAMVEKYLAISFSFLEKVKDEVGMLDAQIVKVELLILKEDYNEAEQWGLFVLEQDAAMEYNPEQFKTIAFYNLKPRILMLLSTVYQKKNNLDKAIYYAKESLMNHPALSEKIDIYQQLSDLFHEKRSYELALQYKDSVLVKKDELHTVSTVRSLVNSQIKLDLLTSEKELAKNKAEQKAERIVFISILIFVIILAIILIVTFRIQSIRNRQRKQITELELEKEKNKKQIMEQETKEKETLALLEQERLNNEKLLLEEKLEKQETLALLEQERLNNEIELKNKQLTARILFQSNRSKLIKELITTFSEVSSEQEIYTLNPIVQKLNVQLKDSEDANNFLIQLEQVNPSLVSPLKEKHPDLSLDDIRFLSYLYLYSDIKKVAHLFNITLDACRKRKERIATKVGIKTVDLYKYLLDIMRSSISEELPDPS